MLRLGLEIARFPTFPKTLSNDKSVSLSFLPFFSFTEGLFYGYQPLNLCYPGLPTSRTNDRLGEIGEVPRWTYNLIWIATTSASTTLPYCPCLARVLTRRLCWSGRTAVPHPTPWRSWRRSTLRRRSNRHTWWPSVMCWQRCTTPSSSSYTGASKTIRSYSSFWIIVQEENCLDCSANATPSQRNSKLSR